MPKNNAVANVLFFMGILIGLFGFVAGLTIGREPIGDDLIWSVVITYWLTGFISGMFFIALSEIIDLIDRKLSLTITRLTHIEDTLKSSAKKPS